MRARLIASVVGGFLCVYVVSMGPVASYCAFSKSLDKNQAWRRVVVGYLYPTTKLCDTCPPVAGVVDRYVRWCVKEMYGNGALEALDKMVSPEY